MRQLTLSAILLGAAILSPTAQAATTVFGDSAAQRCYESVRRNHGDREACDQALESRNLSRRDRAATLLNRGILLNRRKRPEEAIADFNAALRLSGPLAEAYLNRGNSHFLRKQMRAAIADYTQAIRLKCHDLYIAYFNRALAYEAIGRFAEARRDHQTVLKLKPGFAPARKILAELPVPGR